MKIWKLLTIALFLITFGQPASALEAQTETTIGEKREWVMKSLGEHIVSVTRGSRTVKLVTDGKYGIGKWGTDWTKEFELKENESFYAQPDHHRSQELKILKIGKDVVIIGYREKFDHRSFGKNLVTIDVGEVEISFRKNKKP